MRRNDPQTQQPTLFALDTVPGVRPASTPVNSTQRQRQRPHVKRRVVPTSSLRGSPLHPRRQRDGEHLEHLVESIGTHGMLQPPLVRPLAGQQALYEVIIGTRRVEAACRLGHGSIEVRIIEATDVDVLILALVDDLHHRHIAVADKMDAYVALADILGTQAAVAVGLCVSKSEVCKVIRVARHPAARAAVCGGQIQLDHAYDILAGYPEREVDDVLARTAVSGHTQQQSRVQIKANKGKEEGQDVASTPSKAPLSTALVRSRTPARANDPEVPVISIRNDVSSHDNTVSDAPGCIGVSRLSVSTIEQQETVAADDLTILRLYRDTDNADIADVWRALRMDVAMIDARVTMCIPCGDALP